MANDKVAPTSGTTKGAVEAVKDSPLSLDQLDFVTLIAMHYGKYGSLLTAQRAFEEYGMPIDIFQKRMAQSKVRNAIKEHGIEIEHIERAQEESWQSGILTPVQLAAINIMLDMTDQRSDQKKLNDLKLTTRQWNAWMRDPVFRDYVQTKVDNILHHDGVHVAGMALMDRVASGDTKAIEFYYEFIGKFTRRPEASTNTNIVNFQNIVARMVEIIVEECEGPVAERIGSRFKTLMESQNIATQLLEQESNQVIVPLTAPSREITPEIKELMERTGGNT